MPTAMNPRKFLKLFKRSMREWKISCGTRMVNLKQSCTKFTHWTGSTTFFFPKVVCDKSKGRDNPQRFLINRPENEKPWLSEECIFCNDSMETNFELNLSSCSKEIIDTQSAHFTLCLSRLLNQLAFVIPVTVNYSKNNPPFSILLGKENLDRHCFL